ncbi:MAG: hypothetical protein KAG89_19905 [Fulvimarina manganoxydans]|uniref:hypothetical protein n=1 Tax=Fulvimarina manganoxydans TaxID=937218 RepID=UPI0023538E17|nr:hypothetical protein [Fulvimarina manganoxydans]MCK5934424.1 hypothetical protein [Fulvimarina manganoxydans]MEE2949980.1 hypothetical protein [Pseudomonadota bacterium]
MKTVTFEKDGPDTIVRINGTIIGRLTGEEHQRKMQWRAGQDLDAEKVEAFDLGYGDSDRSENAVTRELKKAGFL